MEKSFAADPIQQKNHDICCSLDPMEKNICCRPNPTEKSRYLLQPRSNGKNICCRPNPTEKSRYLMQPRSNGKTSAADPIQQKNHDICGSLDPMEKNICCRPNPTEKSRYLRQPRSNGKKHLLQTQSNRKITISAAASIQWKKQLLQTH